MNRQDSRKNMIIMFLLLIPVVIWLALKVAMCYSTELKLFDMLPLLTASLNQPFYLHLNEYSLKAIFVFLFLYACGVGIYFTSSENRRPGEEHGSAKWGNISSIARKYTDRKHKLKNLILSQSLALSLNAKSHRRNLNVLIVGGSGAGKTRFYAKPNIMQCNTSFVIADPKGEMLRATAPLLLQRGYDRPGFLAMMKEVEAGNVDTIILKDLSRMGRDYLKVGQYVEILRQKGVRLIAINDGVDSFKGEDDFMPFRNIMNEWYARDASRKIKSVFKSKGMSGKHTSSCVCYGYLKSPEDKNQWIIDEEAAEIVKRIFRLTIEGKGPYQIARILESDKVEIPGAHLAKHGEGLHQKVVFENPYHWSSATIASILKKREYLGHTVNFKTRKHFKDKKSHYVDESEWTVFENTHEPIIDQETFDLVQKIRSNVRRYPNGWGEVAPLTGILYCADCGGKMYVHRTNNGKRISQYTCSRYGKVPVGKLCKSQHRINESVVLTLLSDMLKAIAEYANTDREEFIKVVQEAQAKQQTDSIKKQRTRLAVAKQRASELEVLICKIYEDNALGKLPDERYSMLDGQYAKEQSELSEEIKTLEANITAYDKNAKSADKFIALIDKYQNFSDLSITMINEFMEKILVHERDRKGSVETTQEIEIYFNFIGRFIPPKFADAELSPEEIEELKKREARKDRLHQNYLRRKERGMIQKEYERNKVKKKAAMDEKKNAIRAEDIAKGVFIPVQTLPKQEPKIGVITQYVNAPAAEIANLS